MHLDILKILIFVRWQRRYMSASRRCQTKFTMPVTIFRMQDCLEMKLYETRFYFCETRQEMYCSFFLINLRAA